MDTRFPHYDAATGQMCFSNALLCLKRGRSVARANWVVDSHIKLLDGALVARQGTQPLREYTLTHEDLVAEDWLELI